MMWWFNIKATIITN
uniref:Uncharacterized protein n=1 Tax=Lepeophtheirus salmonis TaxID=72036 RepID=A0A0K2TBU2_LEPSM